MTTVRGKRNGVPIDIAATKDGELVQRAIVEDEIEHFSATGRSLAFPSLDTDIDAGDTRLFVKNTSDKFLVLQYAIFNPSNVSCVWNIGIGQDTTTPAGTTVTAINMNEDYTARTFDYVAMDDETAVADASIMFVIKTGPASSSDFKIVPLKGIILGKNHYIQINQETESTSGQVTIFGCFEDELV